MGRVKLKRGALLHSLIPTSLNLTYSNLTSPPPLSRSFQECWKEKKGVEHLIRIWCFSPVFIGSFHTGTFPAHLGFGGKGRVRDKLSLCQAKLTEDSSANPVTKWCWGTSAWPSGIPSYSPSYLTFTWNFCERTSWEWWGASDIWITSSWFSPLGY